MSDTEDRYQRPDPSSSYTQSGDPASFAGGYAGATPGGSRIASNDAPELLPPAPGQVGAAHEPDRVQQDPDAITPFGFRRLTSVSPYIPTAMNPALRDRRHSDWGQPDYVLNGMDNYPDGEMPQGQYIPTEADIPGIINNATMTLGRFGPPNIGMPMITAGRSWLAGMKNYQQGAMQAAQLNERQAKLQMTIAKDRLQELLRKYSAVFATYGPDPDKPGSDFDSDKFHRAISDLANEYGDHYVQNILNTKDYPALERHLRHLDGTSQDLGKVSKQLDIDIKRERLRIMQGKAAAEQKRMEPYYMDQGRTGAPSPTVQVDPTAPGTPPLTQDPDQPDPGLEFSKPEDFKEATPQPEETGQPPEEAGQGDQYSSRETPDTTRLAEGARAAGARVMARDDEGEPTGAPAPGAAPAAPPLPAAATARPGIPADVQEKMRNSPTLRSSVERAQPIDPTQIDQLAQKMANGSIKIQDQRNLPPIIRELAEARRHEIERDMDKITLDPKVTGNQVFTQLDKVNPEFSRTLRGYVSGEFAVPASAWHSASYLNRIVGLGQKADPHFNQYTFQTRRKALLDITTGQDGRTLTSIATADDHLDHLSQAAAAIEQSGGTITWEGLRGSAIANRTYQEWLTQIAPDWAGDPRAKDAVISFQQLVHLISPEVARAQKGAAPTVSEIHDVERDLSAAQANRTLQKQIENSRYLFRQRFKEIGNRFKTASGGHPMEEMLNVFDRFEKGGKWGKSETTEAQPLVPLRSGGSYGDALRRFERRDEGAVEDTRTINGKTYYKRNGKWYDG